jgi:hypothetical protein
MTHSIRQITTASILAIILSFFAFFQSAQAAPEYSAVYENTQFDLGTTAAYDDYLYAWDSSSQQIITVDFTDLENPQLDPNTVVTSNISNSSFGLTFEVIDGYLFVLSTSDLEVYSLDDPSQPTLVDSFSPGARDFALSLSYRDGYIYVVYDVALMVLEMDVDQSTITPVGGSGVNTGYRFSSISEDGSELYLSDDDGNIEVYDISDPTAPSFNESTQLSHEIGSPIWQKGDDYFALSGRVYQGLEYEFGFDYFENGDFSDISQQMISNDVFEISDKWFAYLHQYRNAYLYTSQQADMKIVNVSDPSNPTLVDTLEFSDSYSVEDIAVTDRAIYVVAENSNSGSSLYVYEILDQDADGDNVATAVDCDDTDADASLEVEVAADIDGDGYHDASTVATVCENAIPAGYILVSTSLEADSDDTDSTSEDSRSGVSDATVDNVRTAKRGRVILEMSDGTEERVKLFTKYNKKKKTKVKYHRKRNQYMVYHPKWKKVVALNGTTGEEMDRKKLAKKKFNKGRGRIIRVGQKRVLAVQLRKKKKSRIVFIRLKAKDNAEVFSKKRGKTLKQTKLKYKKKPKVKRIKRGVFRITAKQKQGEKLRFKLKKPKKGFKLSTMQ